MVFLQISSTDRREHRSIANNCDLIREYLARTRAPPPMFRPTTSYMAYNEMPPHRILVDIAYKHPQLLIDKDNGDEDDRINSDATNNMGYDQYHSRSETSSERQNNECKLIGNVNPTLIKTWEQLSGFRSDENILPMANYPMHYGNGDGMTDQTTTNKSFIIRRAAAASGHFYDSIDNESFITQEDDEQLIASICEEMATGGEALAEYISISE